jgi:hypothetical protein
MIKFENKISLEKGKTYLITTKETKLDVLRVDLVKFLARNKGVKTIYVTLHLPYHQLRDNLSKVNVQDFFWVDVTSESLSSGNNSNNNSSSSSSSNSNNSNCVKVTRASPMNVYLEVLKIVDYYSARNLNPPPIVILYDYFPKMGLDMDELIKLTKAMLMSSSHDISAIAVLLKEEFMSSEFEKIESHFDTKLMV